MIRYKTKTNADTFRNGDMAPLINVFKDEMCARIVERNPMIFLVPALDDLRGEVREYAVPDDLLNRIHKVELRFTSSDSYLPASALKDYLGSEQESEIVNNFANSEGEFGYIFRRRALYVLSGSITTVTNGIRMWHTSYPADITDLTSTTDMEVDPTTTTHGFPRQFHELLARRVGIEWKGSQPKPIPLNETEKNYENDMKNALDGISTSNNSLEVIGELPPADDLGDNGWNY